MTYIGVLLGIGIMAAIIRLAVDKKSNFLTRIAALGALALMILTVVICVVLVLTDNRVPVDPSILIVGAPAEVKEKGSDNLWIILLLIVFLAGLFGFVAFISMKENKKQKNEAENAKQQTPKNLVF